MSQSNVERLIGLLATDEAFRRRFTADPRGTLQNMLERGMRLTPCEFHALAAMDPDTLRHFADAIDPRIQKCDLNQNCEIQGE